MGELIEAMGNPESPAAHVRTPCRAVGGLRVIDRVVDEKFTQENFPYNGKGNGCEEKHGQGSCDMNPRMNVAAGSVQMAFVAYHGGPLQHVIGNEMLYLQAR